MLLLVFVLGFVVGGFAVAACLMEADRDGAIFFDGEDGPVTVKLDPWSRGKLGVVIVHFARQVNEGGLVPPGWGLAYYAWDRAAGIYLPIPFNWLARWARMAYDRLRFPDMDAALVSLPAAWIEAEVQRRARNRTERLEREHHAQMTEIHGMMVGQQEQFIETVAGLFEEIKALRLAASWVPSSRA